jgi:hypothetical protein
MDNLTSFYPKNNKRFRLSTNANPVDTTKPWSYAYGWRREEFHSLFGVAEIIQKSIWSPCVWKSDHRIIDDFRFSDFLVLDCDSPEINLNDIKRRFADFSHIIGTTKSHQRPKMMVGRGEIICDRFRLIVELERAVDRICDYTATTERFVRLVGADPQVKDGARFFYPCQEIISFNNDGYKQEIIEGQEVPVSSVNVDKIKYETFGSFPAHINSFIKFGRLFIQESRNLNFLIVARYLANIDFPQGETEKLLIKAPIPHDSNEERYRREIKSTINSAYKYIQRRKVQQENERRKTEETITGEGI